MRKGEIKVYAILYEQDEILDIIEGKDNEVFGKILKEHDMAVIEPDQTLYMTFVSTKQDEVAECAAELNKRYGITPVKVKTGYVDAKYFPTKDWKWS